MAIISRFTISPPLSPPISSTKLALGPLLGPQSAPDEPQVEGEGALLEKKLQKECVWEAEWNWNCCKCCCRWKLCQTGGTFSARSRRSKKWKWSGQEVDWCKGKLAVI